MDTVNGPFFGRCTVDTLCEDDEETAAGWD